LKRVSLIDNIIDEIKGKILSGEYKDGDMLASQDELARQMGVSRASLREALKRLELMGLVRSIQGKGTFVRTVSPSDFMNPLSSFLALDKESSLKLLEARLYIEGAVAALAATNATEDDIEELQSMARYLRHLSEKSDIDTFVKNDVFFHLKIAESSRNPILNKIVVILRDLMTQLVGKVFENAADKKPETLEQTNQFHEQILKAIMDRNPDLARKHMEEHIQDVQWKVKRFNESQDENNAEKDLENQSINRDA
jgi:GntR family transcriptional repressor for pyruvate dehydrogenase complex